MKTADGFHLWSQTYDRTLDDIFAVQDDIAQAVSRELQLTFRSKTNRAQPNSAAYDMVLQARFVLQNRSPKTIEQGVSLLERALALAPDFAPAWAEMGFLYQRRYERATTPLERRELNQKSRDALAKALKLDPDFAIAHSRLASCQRRSWEFDAAENSIKRALEIDPNNPFVLGNASYFYWIMGRTQEAVALAEKRFQRDPLSFSGYTLLAGVALMGNRLDEADSHLQKLSELAPDYPTPYGGYVHLLRGDANEAREAFARLQELDDSGERGRLFWTAIVEHTAGSKDSSTVAAVEFEKRFGGDPLSCAEIRAWRGETDLAFERLNQAFAVRDPDLGGIKIELLLRSLYADARWNKLLKRIGLPPD